ncbi:hypothetical protein [Salinigranum marinum]|uniref:hypothetical protein n=1 Tax=Salinigranum marinum TaxID=1515595 RepID=UPI002989E1E3|nr:hypothetical protein [Salinigranum marinum]
MPSRPTLAARLRGRPREEIAAFVAALYAARGAETHVDGEAAVVDGERYLVVPAGYRARLRHRLGTTAERADRVVAVDPARADALAARDDASVLTPTDLDDLARYGLDRAAADAVFRDRLGVAVGDLAPAGRSTPETKGATPPTRSGSRDPDGPRSKPVPAAVTVVAAAVLAALVLSVAPGSLGADVGVFAGEAERAGASGGVTATPGATTAEAAVANRTSRANGTAERDPLGLAPGLTADGVADPEALADAHAAALANRSYTWEITYVERSNGTEVGRATETVAVAAPSTYVANVSREGLHVSRGPVAVGPSYADGERRYRPTDEGVAASAVELDDGVGPQESRARRFLGVLLDGQETSIVRTILGGQRLYVVDIEGTTESTIRRYSATAHVAPDGVVYYYSGSYCLVPMRSTAVSEVCLSLTMQYRDVGGTVVEPPSWYTEREPTSA